MNERISDTRKLIEIGMWVGLRAVVIAAAYALLKLGSVLAPVAMRFV